MLGMLKAFPPNTMAVPSQKFGGSIGQNNVTGNGISAWPL